MSKTPGRDEPKPDAMLILERALKANDNAEALIREAMDAMRPCGDDPCTLARLGNGEYAREVRA